MEFGILGPLEVVSEGGLVEVRGVKPRALLALLLVHANRVVARDRLIDDLWEGTPPESAIATLQTYVSQLRKSLQLESLHTRPRGYVLEVGDGELDALRFERVLQAVPRVDDPAPRPTAARLGEALSWWRGPALADFEGALWAQAEAARLEGLRLDAVEGLADARLALGEHAALVPELESLVAEHPLRERLWGQLALALYRCDRQADALRVYGRLRRHLGEELGIEPSKELARLEAAILRQEPQLDWRPESGKSVAEATLPSGVMTFLFTDMVGSTRLWEERPEDMRLAVAGQDELVRAAVGDHGGIVVKSTGDGLMAVFDDAASAVAAAVDAQLAVVVADWPVSVALRMGLHTGTARAEDGDYHGPAVNRAARVASTAHPGQILISAATAALIEGWSLRDLGEHRLHGLPPMQLHQVLDPRLADDFPSLMSAMVPVHLPSPPTTFVGRGAEVDAAGRLVDGHRLVTLTGVGGCGKTRLAIEVAGRLASRFPDGVRFVDIAAVTDETQVADAVVRALGLAADRTGSDPAARLTTYLADRAVLCVLDNCEHLLDVCAALIEAIVGRPGPSRLLATSREPLGVVGEQVYLVPPLEADTDAVRLFADRAAEARAGFGVDTNRATIAEICRRLDGIPLAIELAASRMAHLSPAQVLELLDDRFGLLTGGRRVPRHQTLTATLDWSHDLLEPSDQVVLRRLAAFPASFTLEAAGSVADVDDVVEPLGSLVAKSLVQVVDDGERLRYRLLETVRLYAQTKLVVAGEADWARTRQRDWVLAWLESIPLEERWFGETDLLATEHASVRAALEWSALQADADAVARIAAGVDWTRGEHWQDGVHWCEAAVATADALPPELQAQLYLTFYLLGGRALRGPEDWAGRTDWAQRASDASGEDPNPLHAAAVGLRALGAAVSAVGAARAAERASLSPGPAEQSLARQATDWAEASVAMSEQFSVLWRMCCRLWAGVTYTVLSLGPLRGPVEPAQRHFAAGMDAAAPVPPYRGVRAVTCGLLALHRLVAGDTIGALALAQDAQVDVARFQVFGSDQPLALALALVIALGETGDIDAALRELRAYHEAARRADWGLGAESVVFYGGIVAAMRDDWETAARLLAAGEPATSRSPATALMNFMFRDRVAAALGPERFDQLQEEGRAMPVGEALDAGLGRPQESPNLPAC